MLKYLIVILMIALMVSLGTGLFFLMANRERKENGSLLTSLGIRLALGACLLATILYGLATGQLGHQNPWDPGPVSTNSKISGQP